MLMLSLVLASSCVTAAQAPPPPPPPSAVEQPFSTAELADIDRNPATYVGKNIEFANVDIGERHQAPMGWEHVDLKIRENSTEFNGPRPNGINIVTSKAEFVDEIESFRTAHRELQLNLGVHVFYIEASDGKRVYVADILRAQWLDKNKEIVHQTSRR